jgi:hypothetical protein
LIEARSCELPENAIRAGPDGTSHAYTDCFSLRIDRTITLPDFVFAFYTTPVFRLERFVLKLVKKPSIDEQARSLSQGLLDSFAAWSVEQRLTDQLLMCDFRGRTRSWFMVADIDDTAGSSTRLYFGSAVVPVGQVRSDRSDIGSGYKLLLGFHKLYSKVLLSAAKVKLR